MIENTKTPNKTHKFKSFWRWILFIFVLFLLYIVKGVVFSILRYDMGINLNGIPIIEATFSALIIAISFLAFYLPIFQNNNMKKFKQCIFTVICISLICCIILYYEYNNLKINSHNNKTDITENYDIKSNESHVESNKENITTEEGFENKRHERGNIIINNPSEKILGHFLAGDKIGYNIYNMWATQKIKNIGFAYTASYNKVAEAYFHIDCDYIDNRLSFAINIDSEFGLFKYDPDRGSGTIIIDGKEYNFNFRLIENDKYSPDENFNYLIKLKIPSENISDLLISMKIGKNMVIVFGDLKLGIRFSLYGSTSALEELLS